MGLSITELKTTSMMLYGFSDEGSAAIGTIKEICRQLAVVLEEKNKLAEELKEKQNSLDKAIDQRDQFKESNHVNYCAAKQLEEDLAASRQKNTTLEGQIEELKKANASNLERYKNATLRCFYDFSKHNQSANFNYLPENARNAELARCAARLVEEERARIPASSGMDRADNEDANVINQGPPQDPLAHQDPPAP
ncbi:uncharacterized protein LOC133795878 [Humulus lupulus]|uniref:uncharacterized protein LOC133795878 n=1 Tax=Humulus lupulus TaxID=3486 RepID=UPI002B41020A|nr:uncharacterized protein LOC133795878 [Humulus lupulus]